MGNYTKKDIINIVRQIIITIALNIITTLILLLLCNKGFTDVNIVVVYILSVLITSSYTKGYTYGIVASVMSMLSFNYFFTKPVYTFKVDDSAYIITLGIMLLSSIFTSTSASKLIQSKELAKIREKQSHVLYRITSSLARTSELPEVAAVAVGCLSSLLLRDIVCIIVNDKNIYVRKCLEYDVQNSIGKDEMDCYEGNGRIVASDIVLTPNTVRGFINGYFTSTIKVRDNLISYLCMPKEMENMNNEQLFLLDSVKIQIASAMERVVLVRDREAAKSETERERFKSNLLRAISHDIRTPLTRITGAAHMLQHNLGENDSTKLISGIYEDSTWLTHLVENILSLTRIQEGKLNIRIQSEAVEEIISGAISQTTKYAPAHKITITVPQDVLFVPMDGKLIEQVLINLINNAIEHTSPEKEILVSVTPENEKVWFEVKDNGIGIDEKDLTNIFDMFFVSPNSRRDGKQGMGLGLAICKAIITYHGGNITAYNNPEGGSTFRFYLNQSLNVNADE